MTRSRYMVGLVFLVFFVMSLVTNFTAQIIVRRYQIERGR